MDYFDPPPPYSPPSCPTTQTSPPPPPPPPPPLSSQPPPLLSSQPPPPTYNPISIPPKPPSKPPSKPLKILSPNSELLLLSHLLKSHPWPSFYGPPPQSLTTALSIASLWGNTPLVHSLLSTHACKIRDTVHSTAIHAALRGPSPELAVTLFRFFGQEAWILKVKTQDGMTALHVAARNGVPAVVIEELFAGVGKEMLEERDGRGRTALHLAGRFTHRDTIRGLLRLGADPKRVLEKEVWEGVEQKERLGVLGCWGLVYRVLREEVDKLGGRLEVDEVVMGGGGKQAEKVVGEEEEERVLSHGSYARPSMSRTAMPLMLFSDEYQAWKRGCDALLQESRAQRERDGKNESWMLDVMGPRPKGSRVGREDSIENRHR